MNTPEQVWNNITDYAKGEYDGIHKPYIEILLSGGSMSGVVKEKIVCTVIGAEHNPHANGFDGWTIPEKRPLEVKAETSDLEKGTKLSGGAAFGSITTFPKLSEFLDAEQLYYGSGWTEDGQLVYIIETEFNKTKMPDQIYEHVNNIENGSGGTPKINHHQWKDSNFRVLYYRKEYEHLMTGPLKECLLEKID